VIFVSEDVAAVDDTLKLLRDKAYTCYQCGECTGICPVARITKDFRPRTFVQKTLHGKIEQITDKDAFWLCAGCYCCFGVCPQGVNPREVIDDLKSGAAAEGKAPLVVDEDKCIGCDNCEFVCPYGAIKVETGTMISRVDPEKCRLCGSCAAECPAQAITYVNFDDEAMRETIREALGAMTGDEPKIVSFLCNWCAYDGADTAQAGRTEYPGNAAVIRVMCSGRIDPIFVYEAFLSGADGVVVGACKAGECFYEIGNQNAGRRMKKVAAGLKEIGIDEARFKVEWIGPGEERFPDIIARFTEELKG